MKPPISAATEQALRGAMDRLLEGCPRATDGRLTVVNLAIEAGVSRATANRATTVLGAFRQAVAESKTQRESADRQVRTIGEEQERRAVENLLAQHRQARALYQQQERRRAGRAATIVPITDRKTP